MDILIIGAGAVGSLLAFRLGAAGHRVTAVGRSAFVQAVRNHGVLIECAGRAECLGGEPDRSVQAVESVESLGGACFDLVLIATKAFDTAVAAVQALPFVQRGAAALVVQNGVGGVDVAQGILGEQRLYAGVITIPVEMLKPAVIRAASEKGGLGIAPVNGQETAFLVKLFSEAGLAAHSYTDWRSVAWSKLMLNILANAIPAILDWPLEQIYANRRLYELEVDALREALVVAQGSGVRLVSLPGYEVPWLAKGLAQLPFTVTYPLFRRMVVDARAGKRPSLHMDLSRKREKSEVEFLNGAVARGGDWLGVPTPINHALCDILLGIAQGRVAWNEYRGQADRLINRVRSA